MLSAAKVDISAKTDNRITMFCCLEYGFLGVSQRFDIKQENLSLCVKKGVEKIRLFMEKVVSLQPNN